MIIEKRKFVLCGWAGGYNYSRYQVPVCLQVCWFWWQAFTTRFLSCVSSFPNNVVMHFCVTLCKQQSSSSQKAHIEIVLLTLSNLMVWLSLDPASWFGLIFNRNTQISPVTYFNGKRKFSKDTIHEPCRGRFLSMPRSFSLFRESCLLYVRDCLKKGRKGDSGSIGNLQHAKRKKDQRVSCLVKGGLLD